MGMIRDCLHEGEFELTAPRCGALVRLVSVNVERQQAVQLVPDLLGRGATPWVMVETLGAEPGQVDRTPARWALFEVLPCFSQGDNVGRKNKVHHDPE